MWQPCVRSWDPVLVMLQHCCQSCFSSQLPSSLMRGLKGVGSCVCRDPSHSAWLMWCLCVHVCCWVCVKVAGLQCGLQPHSSHGVRRNAYIRSLGHDVMRMFQSRRWLGSVDWASNSSCNAYGSSEFAASAGRPPRGQHWSGIRDRVRQLQNRYVVGPTGLVPLKLSVTQPHHSESIEYLQVEVSVKGCLFLLVLGLLRGVLNVSSSSVCLYETILRLS